MPAAFLLAYIYLLRRKRRRAKIQKRLLRDVSNPMCIPEKTFITLYRINKEAFLMILQEIAPLIKQSAVPENLQLAAALRFLAVGEFEGVVVSDVNITLSRNIFSKVLWKVLEAIQKKLCPKWIRLDMDKKEEFAQMLYFYKNHGLPSVLGCVDCMHARIKEPLDDEYLFYNPKGYFSINVLIICDYKMRIRGVDANKHGSLEDLFVWMLSDLRQHFAGNQENGERRHGWLLGDSDYDLEPFLMTPYKNPTIDSKEYNFNKKLYSALSVVEKTIVNLQSRLRCLQTTTLDYIPLDAVRVINVCSALHNICKHYNVEIEDTISTDVESENDGDVKDDSDIANDDNEASDEENDEMGPDIEAIQIRDEIAESYQNVDDDGNAEHESDDASEDASEETSDEENDKISPDNEINN